MVLGPSGCGKSSLVRTGLLNALKSGFMTSAGPMWRIADFKPGDAPLWNLSTALYSALTPERSSSDTDILVELREIADWHAILSDGINGLVEIVNDAQLPSGTNLVLLADQFEEIFRFRYPDQAYAVNDDENRQRIRKQRSDANAFVNLLLTTSKQTQRHVYVVLTMRSDFIGDCKRFGSSLKN